ncbi:BMC domain-containing protein [Clostridium chauvoei]|nr:BMC domain-containing protein [Clostridium chauvoei]ATD55054.1 microcompartment protein [Clostridium chauvoei]ATD57272.1 microcompartment protein [Clostridium chauvoei]CDG01717.1 Putative Microcompartments protein [Clostridium chauvoei JF4335]SLK17904.1 Putative Microcompartments protein [Clostridium chauvoei JF4335]
MRALGIIEVFGLTTALVAADAACKAGNIKIEALDNNKPANADKLLVPVLIIVKFRGSISDVEMAMKAAISAAKKISGINCSKIIANPDKGIENFINKSCIK